MKKTLLVLSFLLLISHQVFSAEINVECKAVAGADGYKIEISSDLGATWVEVTGLTWTTHIWTSVIEGTQEVVRTSLTVPDNVLVLARVASYNSVGEAWRLESGVFFNSSWKPLLSPKGFGAN